MKLILVRHGVQSKIPGEGDLTIEGLHQAVKLGEELAAVKIHTIYCSPAPRCEQTMDEILRDREDEIVVHFSRLVGPKMKKESFEKLRSRINLFLDDLKYDHKSGETVVVISHLKAIQMMTLLLTGEKGNLGHGEMRSFDYAQDDN